MTNAISFFLLYLLPMLILPWLFLREPCDNPWSRIRKVLFAVLLCVVQLVLVLEFVKSAAVNVNMDARLKLQGYVYDARDALDQEKLSADEVCVRLTEKFYREADPAQWNALKKNVVVHSVLVIAGLLLLAGVLFASMRFKLKTLPFLLLFYGCAAGGFVEGSYLYYSVSELMRYRFDRTAFREVNLAVMARIRKTEDRLPLRLALEDVREARVWDDREMDDFNTCIAMCQDLLSVLYESQKKYESKTSESKTPPETFKSPGAE